MLEGEQSPSIGADLQNWYACWLYVGMYHYNALAWVTSGAPQNPTCKKVSVVREPVAKVAGAAAPVSLNADTSSENNTAEADPAAPAEDSDDDGDDSDDDNE